jgi:hypothetical protein
VEIACRAKKARADEKIYSGPLRAKAWLFRDDTRIDIGTSSIKGRGQYDRKPDGLPDSSIRE